MCWPRLPCAHDTAAVDWPKVGPLAIVPTLLPLGITAYLDYMEWAQGVPVCLPLSLFVCAVVVYIYRLVLPWQGRMLQAREQKILMVVTTKTD